MLTGSLYTQDKSNERHLMAKFFRHVDSGQLRIAGTACLEISPDGNVNDTSLHHVSFWAFRDQPEHVWVFDSLMEEWQVRNQKAYDDTWLVGGPSRTTKRYDLYGDK